MRETVEIQYDDHTLVIADVSSYEDSFDHEFGTERFTEIEIENVSVVTYIGGIDYDVTAALNAKQIEYFREQIFKHVTTRGY